MRCVERDEELDHVFHLVAFLSAFRGVLALDNGIAWGILEVLDERMCDGLYGLV